MSPPKSGKARKGLMALVGGVEGEQMWTFAKNNGAKLLPFFKTLAMYFAFWIPTEEPSALAMALKCLPVVALGLFVLLSGITASGRDSFRRRILFGLVFSCFGDAFLVWPQYFPYGIGAFGVAQVFYISAFGFKYAHWKVAVSLYGFNTVSLLVLVPSMMKNNAPPEVLVGLPIYTMLLMTMVWRALAREESMQEWTWTKCCCGVGGVLFAFSDSLIGVSMFLMHVPYAQFLIMSTYYAAQFLIALSILSVETDGSVDDRKSSAKQKRSKKVE